MLPGSGTALCLALLAPLATAATTALGGTGDPLAATGGYQVGFLAAFALVTIALGAAWRAPRDLGQAPPPPAPAPEPQPVAACDG